LRSYIQIYRGNELKVSGRINSRTLGELVTIQAYTEEILLESNLTPAQYGMVWDGWDLADVARDLLDGWQISVSRISHSGSHTWWATPMLT